MTEARRAPDKVRDVACVLLSVALLLFARRYDGPGSTFLHQHGANLSFSFGAFYILRLLRVPRSGRAWITALLALAGVWLQEGLQAAGLYPGVFDPLDLLYDAGGVVLAWALCVATSRVRTSSLSR